MHNKCMGLYGNLAERELKFRKRMAFSVLGSLRTVPLHSTLAVNNLGLKFVS